MRGKLQYTMDVDVQENKGHENDNKDGVDSDVRSLEMLVENLRRRMEHIETWRAVESKVIEEEVCSRAEHFMREKGFSVVRLPCNKIYNFDGSVFMEWDGIFVAEKQGGQVATSYLCVVEAKHQVVSSHLSDRVQSMERFKRWLSDDRIRDGGGALYKFSWNALRPFADYRIRLFLGGTLFNRELINKAQEMNIFCVHVGNGLRYDISAP